MSRGRGKKLGTIKRYKFPSISSKFVHLSLTLNTSPTLRTGGLVVANNIDTQVTQLRLDWVCVSVQVWTAVRNSTQHTQFSYHNRSDNSEAPHLS